MQQPSSNGDKAKELPTIKVLWCEENYGVGLQFEMPEFKCWEFVVAVLGMAKEKAENAMKVARMEQMAAQQQAAMQQMAVEQQLQRAMQQGKIIHG